MEMSARKPSDDEPTAAFVIPEGLLRRARGEEIPPDTERQPGSKGQSSSAEDIPTAPHPRPLRPSEPARLRPLVDPPRLRRASYRPEELASLPEAPATERPVDEDTLVNMNRDELLRRNR